MEQETTGEVMTLASPPENPYALATADPAAVAAAESAKQRLQAAFVMAKQFPRDQDQARSRILASVRRPRFAEMAEYKKPIGRGHIMGPSIRLAEVCLREWGNVMCETNVVFEDEDSRRLSVTVIDLETNTRFTKEIRISKTVERREPKGREVVSSRRNSYNEVVYTVRATDDELLIKEAANISKALRNEGLRCIPQDIVDEAVDIARATMAGQYTEDPDAARKKLLDAFQAIRISPKMLSEYLGHATTDISLDEWNDLRTLYRGLKEGMTRWQEIMERKRAKTNGATDVTEADDDDGADPTTGGE
jgi:hypothetical protein